MNIESATGDILIELKKLSEYHAAQVKLWQDMLTQSMGGASPYAKRMLAMHLDFGSVLFIVSQELSKSKTLEGTAT